MLFTTEFRVLPRLHLTTKPTKGKIDMLKLLNFLLFVSFVVNTILQ